MDIPCRGFSWAAPPCDKGGCKSQDARLLAANLAAYGPAGISVDAGGNAWQLYKRGVLTAKHCKPAVERLDHAVQLVGFGEAAGQRYWIVRNSW